MRWAVGYHGPWICVAGQLQQQQSQAASVFLACAAHCRSGLTSRTLQHSALVEVEGSSSDAGILESVGFTDLKARLQAELQALDEAGDDAQAMQIVASDSTLLVTDVNKALHSLRRRKVPCPGAVQSVVAFKGHVTSLAQMASMLTSKGLPSVPWDALQPLSESFLELPDVTRTPFLFRKHATPAQAQEFLRHNKYSSVYTLLEYCNGLSQELGSAEAVQRFRGSIMEGLLGRLLQSSKRTDCKFDHSEIIVGLLSPVRQHQHLFTLDDHKDFSLLCDALSYNEANPAEDPQETIKRIEELGNLLDGKEYVGKLKSIQKMPLFVGMIQATTKRMSDIKRIHDRKGCLFKVLDHAQQSVLPIASVFEALSSTEQLFSLPAMMDKAEQYVQTLQDPHPHKCEFDTLADNVAVWANERLVGDAKLFLDEFFHVLLNDSSQVAASNLESRIADLREAFVKIAGALSYKRASSNPELKRSMACANSIVELARLCREVHIKASDTEAVTENTLLEVAGWNKEVADIAVSLDPVFNLDLRAAYEKWSILSPLRAKAYDAYKTKLEVFKLPAVESAPCVYCVIGAEMVARGEDGEGKRHGEGGTEKDRVSEGEGHRTE